MATGYRHSGERIAVASASGAIASGAFCVQEGFWGVAKTSIATGASGWLEIQGVHVLPVPASTVKGDVLYIAGTLPLGDSVAATLTRTATGGIPVLKAVGDRDANGAALCLILPQG